MAASMLNPVNGAVALPNLGGTDFAAFTYRESQNTESVAVYGTATYDPYRGSGTPHASGNAAGFCKAHAATTQPGGPSVVNAAGASGTLTFDTGVTIVLPMVIGNLEISHGRLRAAVPISFNWEGAGDAVYTWPVS